MPETAKRTARVPILGEDGRISDDYIPAAIGENTAKAEAAATRAETAATDAESAKTDAETARTSAESFASNAVAQAQAAKESADGASGSASQAASSASAAKSSEDAAAASAASAAESSADAMGFRNNAVQYRDQAREAAQEAKGYVDTVQLLSQNATNSATAAQNSATSAFASAEIAATAETNASASATNAAASAQTASQKADAVLDHYIESATATTLDPGSDATATVADKVLQLGIPKGDKGDPGEVSAVQAAEGSDLSVSTDGGTVTIDDSAIRARIAELENQAANVVTGTSTDLVAHGEDAYAQKPIETRIKGRTWVNRWAKPSGPVTVNGVNATVDETGLITLSGTSGAGDTYIDLGNALGVAPGKQYTLASSVSFNAEHILLVQRDAESGFLSNVQISSGTTSTMFTSDASMSTMMCRIEVDPGTTVNTSFRVMLVDGTEAPDCFTPPASIMSVETSNLVTSGKNLFDYIKQAGSYFTAGTLSAGTYTMSLDSLSDWWTENGGNDRRIYWYMYDNLAAAAAAAAAAGAGLPIGYTDSGIADFVGADIGVRSSATLTTDTSGCTLFIAHYGPGWIDQVSNIQLELGTTATSYEPPSVTATPLPEVELRSLPNGTCDELVIKADGTCEVERRTVFIELDGSVDERIIKGTTKEKTQVFALLTNTSTNIGFNVICDILPTVLGKDFPSLVGAGKGNIYIAVNKTDASTLEEFRVWLAENKPKIVYLADKSTEPQSPVTLPVLPAPTFNQYHDSAVPSETSTEYARDINIVLSNLEAVQTALLGGE